MGARCVQPSLLITSVQLNNLQIKYLRVPDTLLDTVKEEQTRAREAGRSARGGGSGMRGGAFELISLQCQVRHTDHDRLFACVHYPCTTRRFHGISLCYCNFHTGRGAPSRGGLFILLHHTISVLIDCA